MIHTRRMRLMVCAGLLLVLAACGPEAGRQRGQPGADVNNKVIVNNQTGGLPAIQPNSKVWSTRRP